MGDFFGRSVSPGGAEEPAYTQMMAVVWAATSGGKVAPVGMVYELTQGSTAWDTVEITPEALAFFKKNGNTFYAQKLAEFEAAQAAKVAAGLIPIPVNGNGLVNGNGNGASIWKSPWLWGGLGLGLFLYLRARR